MGSYLLVGLFVVCTSVASVSGLTCYQCANVQVTSGSLSSFGPINVKSDPSCASIPSNTATCRSGEMCGTVRGQISAMGLKAELLVRDCMPSSFDRSESGSGMSSIVGISPGGCTSTNSLANLAIGQGLSALTKIPGMKFSGSVCVCNIDYCSLCEGGVEIIGYCFKYWMLALIGVGVAALLISFICCCCCCCCGWCCCKKGHRGMVHTTPYHTLTMVQTPTGSTPNHLSIQSGDIVYPSSNQQATMGVAYPSGAGLAQDREHAGYNQAGDRFGPALA